MLRVSSAAAVNIGTNNKGTLLLLFALWHMACLSPCQAFLLPFDIQPDWGSFLDLNGLLFRGCVGLIPKLLSASQVDELRIDWSGLVTDGSVLQVADAGEYYGEEGIQEYTDFITTDNPYIARAELTALSIQFEGYDAQEGTCSFLWLTKSNLLWDETNVRYAAEFNFGSMLKIFYKPAGGIVSRLNVVTSEGFIRLIYGRLMNSDNTRRFICDVKAGPCNDGEDGGDVANCQEDLAQMDVFTENLPWIDGRSQACRALHATFADTNPSLHCPHIAFAETADPNGAVKCQESDLVSPEDLFDEKNFQYYSDFLRRNDIDPAIGHDELECEEDASCPPAPPPEPSWWESLFGWISGFVGNILDFLIS